MVISKLGGNDSGPVNGNDFDTTRGDLATEDKIAAEFASEIKPFGESAGPTQSELNRNLGGSVVASEGMFNAAPAPSVQGLMPSSEVQEENIAVSSNPNLATYNSEAVNHSSVVNTDAASQSANLTETGASQIGHQRPKFLGSDGSTEKKFKISFNVFGEEDISKSDMEELKKSTERYEEKGDLAGLNDEVNRWIPRYQRDYEGRMFGDDGNEGLINEGANMGGSTAV